MKLIQSRDNPAFRHLVRVVAGKVRGQVVLEGVHVCQEWLRHQGQPLCAVFDASKLAQSIELQALADALDDSACLSIDAALWAKLSTVAGAGQGVCFQVSTPVPELPAQISENCLWLDRIQDPGNLGTLMRTAAAVGIRQVFISPGSASAWSSKVLRSAQGAHFALDIFENADLSGLVTRLEVALAVTTLDGGTPLYDTTLPAACAWLAGNEGQGVDARLQDLATLRVFIPQTPAVESLNVGVAMAVCLYEQVRQHRHS
ncbi:MAG: TrmH family RNA methyltransferase [Pusillimonas sp.]